MNTLDLHPEELFDKAVLGTLSASERVWLDRHLEQCEVCRFEQQVRADFAAEPALALNVDSLVTQALSGIPRSADKPYNNRSRNRTVAWMAGTALALSTMASFASVAQWSGLWPKIVEVFVTVPRPAPLPVPDAPRRSGARRPPEPEAVIAAPPPPELTIEAPVPVVAAEPAAVRSVKRQAPPPPVLVPAENASLLFDAANRARVQGDHALAAKEYRGLLERFPSAPEANLTRATLGRLLLDTGDLASALSHLDAYLRSGELTLREEVLSARAAALFRLGRTAEEAAAWSALLDAYPDSIHAARARARLEELGPH
jgi:hypothetical protein